jgi:hypothetical protein
VIFEILQAFLSMPAGCATSILSEVIRLESMSRSFPMPQSCRLLGKQKTEHEQVWLVAHAVEM